MTVRVPRLSAGILTADLSRLGADLDMLRGTGVWAHVDVMDGRFCPALTVGAPVVKAAASCGVPVDAHLMVEEPRRFLPEFADAGASVITVHAESTRHLVVSGSAIYDGVDPAANLALIQSALTPAPSPTGGQR